MIVFLQPADLLGSVHGMSRQLAWQPKHDFWFASPRPVDHPVRPQDPLNHDQSAHFFWITALTGNGWPAFFARSLSPGRSESAKATPSCLKAGHKPLNATLSIQPMTSKIASIVWRWPQLQPQHWRLPNPQIPNL